MNLWVGFLNVLKAILSKSDSQEKQITVFRKSFSWTGFSLEIGKQEMTLTRMVFTNRSTQGELWIDGKLFCYTLEPTCRSGPKILGVTAIPAKRYQVAVDYSNKFGRKMPFLLNVPNFEGIMIHTGNIPSDTQGCILVGQTSGSDYVGESRAAFDKLLPIISQRSDNQMLFITVLGGRVADV